MDRKKNYNFGILAEYLAIIYLALCFYKIISRRHKKNVGEIDIIASKGKNIIFIEVKARKDKSNIYDSLSKRQQNRITQAASLFIAKNSKYHKKNIRFDLILVTPSFFIKHIKNAWMLN